MKIEKLSWEQTIPVRHKVLWPNKEPDYCRINGDEDALHFGVFNDCSLSCVASLYIKEKSARLRKFATLKEHQGKGIGTFMLKHLIYELKSKDIDYLWLDARETATDFYSRFGFSTQGARFYKNEVPYFKMHMSI